MHSPAPVLRLPLSSVAVIVLPRPGALQRPAGCHCSGLSASAYRLLPALPPIWFASHFLGWMTMALGPEANLKTNQVECSGFSFSTYFVS